MLPEQAEGFFAAIGASETERLRFEAYDRELLATSAHTNLIARATLPDRWQRHYADSAQLADLLPADADSLLDIGSGAGFPGMVIAILAQDRLPRLRLTLCDSVGKKAAFLTRVAENAALTRLQVIHGRVENLPASSTFAVVTARAVTALPALLALAAPRLDPDGVLVFPKGQRAEEELDRAREQWSFECESVASRTDRAARILLIRSPERKK